MYTYKNLSLFTITHPFNEIRTSGNHNGIDVISEKYKKQEIFSLLDGTLYSQNYDRDWGNYIVLLHNTKYFLSISDKLFSVYAHMSQHFNSDLKYNSFLPINSIVGYMGNTGNCLTFNQKTNSYRILTAQEIENPESIEGVHLHYSFYQHCADSQFTKLLAYLQTLGYEKDKDFFWRSGKVWINPDIIMKLYYKNV